MKMRNVLIWLTLASIAGCTETIPPLPQSAEVILENPSSFGLRDRNYGLTESPDGMTRAFVGQRGDQTKIYISRKNDTAWSDPEILNFASREVMMSPHFSPLDGRLYFATDAQHPDRRGREDLNLWSGILNEDNTLSDAKPLPDEINTGAQEDSIAFAEDGTFVFTSDYRGGAGGFDLYIGQVPEDGDVWTFENFAHNTRMADTQVTMTRDGQTIFYYAHLPVVRGIVDLFRADKVDGVWSEPVNLGPKINSEGIDYGAGLSADETLFFFSRDGQIMQIDAKIAMEATGQIE